MQSNAATSHLFTAGPCVVICAVLSCLAPAVLPHLSSKVAVFILNACILVINLQSHDYRRGAQSEIERCISVQTGKAHTMPWRHA